MLSQFKKQLEDSRNTQTSVLPAVPEDMLADIAGGVEFFAKFGKTIFTF